MSKKNERNPLLIAVSVVLAAITAYFFVTFNIAFIAIPLFGINVIVIVSSLIIAINVLQLIHYKKWNNFWIHLLLFPMVLMSLGIYLNSSPFFNLIIVGVLIFLLLIYSYYLSCPRKLKITEFKLINIYLVKFIGPALLFLLGLISFLNIFPLSFFISSIAYSLGGKLAASIFSYVFKFIIFFFIYKYFFSLQLKAKGEDIVYKSNDLSGIVNFILISFVFVIALLSFFNITVYWASQDMKDFIYNEKRADLYIEKYSRYPLNLFDEMYELRELFLELDGEEEYCSGELHDAREKEICSFGKIINKWYFSQYSYFVKTLLHRSGDGYIPFHELKEKYWPGLKSNEFKFLEMYTNDNP